MNANPHEQHGQPDPWLDAVPKPDEPEQPRQVRQVPEAVEAATATKTKRADGAATTTSETKAEAAEVEQKLERHRARGVEWVRPTDLIARNSASMAGRGIDLEVELARQARAPMVRGLKGIGERAKRLSPLSAFGHGARHHAPTRAAVGKS
ncbi:hypothetical protein brsh051_11270 [Brooklawnia propionicigenes]|uniref:Uncharacterized protein n=1 Tax=Brooklawnia propionicigenes TaxID=3041175 RepID=A0AAN0K6G9_9ACTN|nr:hypothetical protein [Brooklawnia sp. SH051]BEH01846.1 hypothetical protein brsh051_11270 [Brooklawnia sp. SH051]